MMLELFIILFVLLFSFGIFRQLDSRRMTVDSPKALSSGIN